MRSEMSPVYQLRHPRDRRRVLRYGCDPEAGCWGESYDGVVAARYESACTSYNLVDPIIGLLRFACRLAYVGVDDVEDALRWIDGHDGRLGGHIQGPRAPRRMRRVLRIMANLKAAGG
jgi:hypothetical protein